MRKQIKETIDGDRLPRGGKLEFYVIDDGRSAMMMICERCHRELHTPHLYRNPSPVFNPELEFVLLNRERVFARKESAEAFVGECTRCGLVHIGHIEKIAHRTA